MHLEVLYSPRLLDELEPDEIIDIFKEAREKLKDEPAFLEIENSDAEATFVGDLHGDFKITKVIVKNFLEKKDKSILIFLGDYIDREPEPEGAVKTFVYLSILKNHFKDRVYLLKGNHEAHYAVYCYPYEFDRLLVDTYGKYGEFIHSAAVELFKEMPLMVKTQNGIVASHAGFPLRGQSIDHKSRRDLILDILWADPVVSPMFRGFDIPKFTEAQLLEFLSSIRANCFIRGHDPYIAGKVVFSKKCVTLSTSRAYAHRAGISVATVKLSQYVKDADDISIVNPTFSDTSE